MEEFNYQKFIGLNDDIIKIRTTVFIDEQGFKDEFDETDKTCSHIVLYDNGKPIATCRYYKEDETYHIAINNINHFILIYLPFFYHKL